MAKSPVEHWAGLLEYGPGEICAGLVYKGWMFTFDWNHLADEPRSKPTDQIRLWSDLVNLVPRTALMPCLYLLLVVRKGCSDLLLRHTLSCVFLARH